MFLEILNPKKRKESINNKRLLNNINKVNNENEEINKNYFNTEGSKNLNDNNMEINIDNNNIKKISKVMPKKSKSITPQNKLLFFDRMNKNEKNINSPIKNKILLNNDINASHNSNSDSINNEHKKRIILKDKNNEINLAKQSPLKKIILKCLNDNILYKTTNSFRNKNKINKNFKTKYNHTYTYRKSFDAKNNEKLLKNFQKYAYLLIKKNENNVSNDNDYNIKENNIFKKEQRSEKDKLIKKNFCKFGSKTISSLINTINSDQIELNNRLFKIIDKANKNIRKEKKIDKVLEIILDKKIKKKKRIRAKDIFIDATNSKKLLEERNKIRFMMRFADLIKDMNDEIALNYTKQIIGKNAKMTNEFILPGLVEYKKLKKIKYIENQKKIRNKLLNQINEIETKLIINGIEKDNLYNKYDSVLKKNKLLKENNNKYINSKSSKEEINSYHNIESIITNFDKIINE